MSGEHVYALPPIDDFEEMGWSLFVPDADSERPWIAPDLAKFDRILGGAPRQPERSVLGAAVRRALGIIRTHPFYREALAERTGPWYMPMPSAEYEDGIRYAVALKIVNNGTTFVWSPCELPWLTPYLALTPTAIAAIERATST